jgi:hypothetical protein
VNGLTELHRFEWNGILLEITYQPQWLPPGILGDDVAHLEVRSLYPTDVSLPFAKHGFFSSTVLASTVAAAGGPVNYADLMLAAENAAGGAPRVSAPNSSIGLPALLITEINNCFL